jgi:hypothetical protein
MMPPNCCLCDKGLKTGDHCELIYFHRTENDEGWYIRASSETHFSDHPPDCGWFCKLHMETAQSFANLDLKSALLHIQTNECWNLVCIDLFDRDTLPWVSKSGFGFESGFIELWHKSLETVEASGVTYPIAFKLSLPENVPDYSFNRWPIDEVLSVKQFLTERNDASKLERKIAITQARELRNQGITGMAQWLSTLCVQFTEQEEPELLRGRLG